METHRLGIGDYNQDSSTRKHVRETQICIQTFTNNTNPEVLTSVDTVYIDHYVFDINFLLIF